MERRSIYRERAGFYQHVLAFDALVVQHDGRAVDGNAGIYQVRKDEFFRILCAHGIRRHKERENGFH